MDCTSSPLCLTHRLALIMTTANSLPTKFANPTTTHLLAQLLIPISALLLSPLPAVSAKKGLTLMRAVTTYHGWPSSGWKKTWKKTGKMGYICVWLLHLYCKISLFSNLRSSEKLWQQHNWPCKLGLTLYDLWKILSSSRSLFCLGATNRVYNLYFRNWELLANVER